MFIPTCFGEFRDSARISNGSRVFSTGVDLSHRLLPRLELRDDFGHWADHPVGKGPGAYRTNWTPAMFWG